MKRKRNYSNTKCYVIIGRIITIQEARLKVNLQNEVQTRLISIVSKPIKVVVVVIAVVVIVKKKLGQKIVDPKIIQVQKL